MDNFRLAEISIIMLGSTDFDRSLEFYTDRLGLSVQSRIPGFAFLNAGSVTLCLSSELARATGAPVAGATEVVFSVPSVTKAYRSLAGRGVSFTREPRKINGPFWAANFNDPDGHKLSIFGNE